MAWKSSASIAIKPAYFESYRVAAFGFEMKVIVSNILSTGHLESS